MFSDDVFLVGFGDGAILVSGFFSTEDFEITKFYSKFKTSFRLNNRQIKPSVWPKIYLNKVFIYTCI